MPGYETEWPAPAVYQEVILIGDQQQRLIGVEVRADDRKSPGWNSGGVKNPQPRQGQRGISGGIGGGIGLGGMPMAGGALGVQKLNPYYDLMILGANAAAGREVEYQIVRNRDNPAVVVPGITCIHTYLAGSGIGNFKKYASPVDSGINPRMLWKWRGPRFRKRSESSGSVLLRSVLV